MEAVFKDTGLLEIQVEIFMDAKLQYLEYV